MLPQAQFSQQSSCTNEERRKDLPTGQSPLTTAFVKLQPELCEGFAKVVGFNPSSLRAKSPQSFRVPSFRSFPSSRPQAHLHLELTWDKARVLWNGLLFSTAWPGSLRMRDAVNTQGSGPNRPALLLRPISVEMTDLLIPEPQVDTGDFPPPRLGFDLRSAGQEQLCLTCAVACRVHRKPLAPGLSLSPQLVLMSPECTADWDASQIWGLSACLYNR